MEMSKKKKLGIAPSPAVVAERFQRAAQDLHEIMKKGPPVAPGADEASDGFTREKIVCNRGPTYEFWGKLLGEYSTNPKRDRSKWTELRLWETPSGQWVAESAGCSDEPGHVDIADALVIRGPVVLVDRQTLKDFEEKTPQTLSMEFQAMEFWGWSSPAKALAKRLGWNLLINVE
ncbi:MAG TPA: hypothetical protein DHB48_16305 [Sphingobium sp.]|nr:hypothetical protein [Sphingobium sp.]|tara:strand:+ start:10786 stop:11310 length:525 start_codon:yes stop_codon:yes gene_type:complete